MVSGPGADERVVFIARSRSVKLKSLLYQGVVFGSKGIVLVLWICVIWGVGWSCPANSLARMFATSTGLVWRMPPTRSIMAGGSGEARSLRILLQILVVVVVLVSDCTNAVQLFCLARRAVCRNSAAVRL